MGKPLVIVESPAKARTIAGYLGDDYVVESSVGHIRDLPQGAADVPTAYKGEPWARLGVDTENDFKPLYVVTGRAKDQVRHLKQMLAEADELYLATDEDREGEAIAWHLLEVLGPRVPVKRMVFHEITRRAIEEAIASPRDIDRRLVDAQEARRILDRLFGYELSPVLWKKIMPRLSAGRVQSVAVRIVVERERERMAFVPADYWDVDGLFAPPSGRTAADEVPDDGERTFGATLVAVDDARLATGRDFGQDGRPSRDDVVVLDEAGARSLASGLADADFTVDSVESKPYRRRPSAPFMTSTLQQDAGRKLGFSSARTMRAAQHLYESGIITYMRTDSTTLSEDALTAARRLIGERYGPDQMPSDGPRRYAKKVKNAQEAHEAIRPAGDVWRSPEQIAGQVGTDEARVYDLVWRRTVASQMIDATGETVTVRLVGTSADGRRAAFSTSGTVITSPGFRLAYVEDSDDPADTERAQQLPPLEEGAVLAARSLTPEGHTTSPPARFTEATLVRRLEELGVGRPSTYASIMETIQNRGYVWKKGSALVPAFTAFATVGLLENHFPDLVDYAFTARMEDDLDGIAGGRKEVVPWLSAFYFGDGDAGLKAMVSDQLGEIDARQVNSIPLGVDADGVPVVARVGRYGPYVERGEDRASIPEDVAPDELTIDRAVELLSAPSDERVLGADPETGLEVYAKPGRFGPYVQLGASGELDERPRTASLFQHMALDTVTLEQAVQLLSLPRVVGAHPDDGEEITAQNGRYGPYLKKGSDSRSLETEDQIFTVSLEEAVALYAQPKRRRGAQPKPPLREMGTDPATGLEVVLKDGRYGPYFTDGETNASLHRGDEVESVTIERASELLAERRAAGPAKKRGRKKAAAKKATPERAAKKKAAKKRAAKKKATPERAVKKKAAGSAPDEAG